MSEDFLSERRKALEDSFFHKKDAELVRQLQQTVITEMKRKELAAVSGITDVALLDRLIRLNLAADTVAALTLVPLVRVAWADGKLDEAERAAILKAAANAGFEKGSAGFACLTAWLDEMPGSQLTAAWSDYVKALAPTLSEDDRQALRDGIVGQARIVAEAAGGFLGLGNKVSETEQAEINRIVAVFQ